MDARNDSPPSPPRGVLFGDQGVELMARELWGLVQTSRLVHTVRDLDELLVLITEVAAEMLDAEGSSVVLRDREHGDLVFYAVSGQESPKLTTFRQDEGEGIVGHCICTRSPILTDDPRGDPRFSDRADARTGYFTRSILCAPLMVEEKCIGAIEIVNKRRDSGFDQYDLITCEAVASQVAVAIHNVQLARAAVQAARLAAIGQAVATISHCIKNMTNGLVGALYFLRKDLRTARVDVAERGLVMFDRHLGRLNELVREMLLYSKDRPPEYSDVDLNELIGSVVDLMQPRAREHGLALRLHTQPGVGTIAVDEQGIYRCVLNLVTNALEASETPGASVDIATRPEGLNQVIVEVADEGCGMDEATMERLFQPFFSSKGSKGTGLGLTVTQKIIQEHGGTIQVESSVGHGSTFRIRLPRQPPRVLPEAVLDAAPGPQ